jgi:hypothetical protein
MQNGAPGETGRINGQLDGRWTHMDGWPRSRDGTEGPPTNRDPPGATRQTYLARPSDRLPWIIIEITQRSRDGRHLYTLRETAQLISQLTLLDQTTILLRRNTQTNRQTTQLGKLLRLYLKQPGRRIDRDAEVVDLLRGLAWTLGGVTRKTQKLNALLHPLSP